MDTIEVAADGTVKTPPRPIIPFIEGDGTGRDIWRASVARVRRRRREGLRRQAEDRVVRGLAGEKAFKQTNNWLPDETVEAFKHYLVGIKGPLTTPVGGGIRSLNVALRQMLDLYVCLRPVRYFTGVPSPVQAPREGRHGDLPREHRGHLRRHRVGGGERRRRRRSSSSCRRRWASRRSASRRRAASASSRSRARERSAWSAPRSSTRSSTSARASRSCTRATS